MRIVIEMQGAQTESRFRGIGRYTMAFAKAIVRNRGEHEVVLALSGLFPNAIEPVRTAFEGLLPQENIRVWQAPKPTIGANGVTCMRREVAELIREAFLASLQPDVIHISSLFEGYVDDAVTSIGRFDRKTPVSVTLYDLIPLLNPEQYLKPHPRYEAYYNSKIESLNKASMFLAISDYAKREAKVPLAVDEKTIVSVSTAIEDGFTQREISAAESSAIQDKYAINQPFVLYTGGADERKNLPRLIQAYAALGKELRKEHQLVFAGKMPEGEVENLENIASNNSLEQHELVFTGYISDETLVALYNLCKLYVFPSWHEGFGLPALEAMACGAPVISANTTSLPEVIGLEEALFDPFDVHSITAKIRTALTDSKFRQQLCDHARHQAVKFSWDITARTAISTWHSHAESTTTPGHTRPSVGSERDSLLAAIARYLGDADDHLLTTVAANLAHNERAGIERQLLVDVSELCQNDAATGVQRVVRSYLHHLLCNPPRGFRVQPIYATQTDGYRYAKTYTARALDQEYADIKDTPIYWQRGDLFFGLDMQHHVQLAHADTFARLRQGGVVVKFMVYDLIPIQLADYFIDNNAKHLHEQWLAMIARQDEAICISKTTADAYKDWIATNRIETAPEFRIGWVHMGADLEGSEPSRGLTPDAPHTLQNLHARPTFLTVSTLEPRKAQAQILDAVEHLWQRGDDINLVLVGQQGWKVDALVNRIVAHPENGKRLFWLNGISDEYLDLVYKASTCLIAASINEGFGLPLIEAARHGIPIIARDIPVFREVAGECALYFSGETGEQLAETLSHWLVHHRKGTAPQSTGMHWLSWQRSTEKLKVALVLNNYTGKQLLVDISELVQRDAKSGIQRVVRNILWEWLQNPPPGYRVEPVYASEEQPYRSARGFKSKFMEVSGESIIGDEPIDYASGDIFLGLDLQPQIVPAQRAFYQTLRQQGLQVKFVVYDLLCVLLPQYFVRGAADGFARWLEVATENDGAVCISHSVARELGRWVDENASDRLRPFKVDWFKLGADSDNTPSFEGPPPDTAALVDQIGCRPSFLMVGTLEPRKGHSQVLDAFDKLWQHGLDINLVVCGKQGWMMEKFVDRLRRHPELKVRLFWLDGIGDEYLDKLYSTSHCLIAASYGEGYGLPLIEAAKHKLPVIARAIPIFQEVAGDHAFYFDSIDCEALANSIQQWLTLYEKNQHPLSEGMAWLTWKESAQQLLDLVIP